MVCEILRSYIYIIVVMICQCLNGTIVMNFLQTVNKVRERAHPCSFCNVYSECVFTCTVNLQIIFAYNRFGHVIN